MDLIENWILEGITLRGMRKHDDIALIDRVFFFLFFLDFERLSPVSQNDTAFRCQIFETRRKICVASKIEERTRG